MTSTEAFGTFAQSRAMVLRKSMYSRRMHGFCLRRRRAMRLGADDLVAGALGRGQQALGAFRLLGAALLDTAHEESLRVVLGGACRNR